MNALAVVCAVSAVLVATSDPHGSRLERVVPWAPTHSVVSQIQAMGVRLWGRRRASGLRMRRDVVDLADAWTAELKAGKPPAPAMARALADGPAAFVQASEQVRLGADPESVLLGLSTAKGAEGIKALAACWSVSQGAGAGLAKPAQRVAVGLRDDLAVREELQAQIAAPQSTARLIAALPLAGPLLGALVGANTVGVLIGTPWGRICLGIGVALNGLGAWWVHRIVRTVAPK